MPGENRLAFGVLDAKRRFVYGKTAVYVGRSPSSRAQGPYAAPADSLVTEARYRSRQAAKEDGPLAAIYAAKVPFKRAGRYAVLVVTKAASGLLGATTEITVRRETPIPALGERPPPVSTDTTASGGSEKAVDTRVPPAPELHQTNLKDVLGCQTSVSVRWRRRDRGTLPRYHGGSASSVGRDIPELEIAPSWVYARPS